MVHSSMANPAPMVQHIWYTWKDLPPFVDPDRSIAAGIHTLIIGAFRPKTQMPWQDGGEGGVEKKKKKCLRND